MSKNRFLPLLFVCCAPLLASCSTIVNGSTEQVTFKTINAEDAYCIVQVGTNDYRYAVRPPQTLWVQRSRKPMLITCTAPGNRTKTALVESNVASSAFLNGLTAGTTLAWDAGSGAMYDYPEEIVIDFSASDTTPEPLPSYHNKGAIDPKTQGIEYMGPDTPVLEGDKDLDARYKAAYSDAAREDAENAAMEAEKQRRIDTVEGGFYGDKGANAADVKSGPKTAPKKANQEVQIAPLSEAAPIAAPTTTAHMNDGMAVPQANPHLGKPIFPSSTTF